MPGTEAALEEMMYRVLGDQLAAGGVTKVMDDLYCGGATPEEALSQWEQVLKAFSKNGLRLSATKTIICPQSTTILGWIWDRGTIKASPHRLSISSNRSSKTHHRWPTKEFYWSIQVSFKST